MIDALAAQGELENTLFVYTSDNGFFHGEHRVRGQDARLRAVDPGAAGDPRPRGAGRRRRSTTWPSTPTSRRRSSSRPAPAPGLTMDGRSLLPAGREHPSAETGPRDPDRDALLLGGEDRPLRLRRAHAHGRARAVRPRQRPVRAPEPARRPRLRPLRRARGPARRRSATARAGSCGTKPKLKLKLRTREGRVSAAAGRGLELKGRDAKLLGNVQLHRRRPQRGQRRSKPFKVQARQAEARKEDRGARDRRADDGRRITLDERVSAASSAGPPARCGLAALPARLALLGEGADPLAEVLGGEARLRSSTSSRLLLGGEARETTPGSRSRACCRARRVGRWRLSRLASSTAAASSSSSGNDLVDEPDPLGPLGIDVAAGEEQLLGPRDADHVDEAPPARCARRSARAAPAASRAWRRRRRPAGRSAPRARARRRGSGR